MTSDDIIRMARGAWDSDADPWLTHEQRFLERFAALVVAANNPEVAIAEAYRCGEEAGRAAEREACADICDQHASAEGIAQRCAAAIRARGQE